MGFSGKGLFLPDVLTLILFYVFGASIKIDGGDTVEFFHCQFVLSFKNYVLALLCFTLKYSVSFWE